MGLDVPVDQSQEAVRTFTKALLRDLQALEQLLADDRIEKGIHRFGAEQEVFLVDGSWRPAPVSVEVLESIDSDLVTTELARFNLEVNLEPRVLEGRCFTSLEERILAHLRGVREAAQKHDADVVLAGILPTLTKSDLSLDNITPRHRYYALNDALTRMRGGAYRLRIEGTDELHIEHDSVMLESCNTSCQVHLQVTADEFAQLYNAAQAVTAPVLAASVNSPLLFGKRLWAETRIALFQQSLDTRGTSLHLRELSPRVRFGDSWVQESVTELFQEDIARFRVLLPSPVEEDPLEVLSRGGVPRLQALQLHNSTVYRWNRPCYGISEGLPHLRIECRAIPSGPSVRDEVANAAFWIGSVIGLAQVVGDVRTRLAFDDAKSNFLAAARMGLGASFTWLDGDRIGARDLILESLLPIAERGLEHLGVAREDARLYLDVVRDRVRSGQTGSEWILNSLVSMKDEGTRGERLAALTSATAHRQWENVPVHEWELASVEEGGGAQRGYVRVEQYMTTSLFTVNEDELVDMVAFLMDRKKIRHVLVEDNEHRLVGIVSYRSIVRLVSQGRSGAAEGVPVKEIMERNPVTVTPETATLDALDLMRSRGVSCVPVVKDEKLVGIVSEHDYVPIIHELLREKLGSS